MPAAALSDGWAAETAEHVPNHRLLMRDSMRAAVLRVMSTRQKRRNIPASLDRDEFRLTDVATGEWHFDLSTKSLSRGIWQIRATLSDGSTHTAFIELK